MHNNYRKTTICNYTVITITLRKLYFALYCTYSYYIRLAKLFCYTCAYNNLHESHEANNEHVM